jgi:nitrate/TMAO reductase-like tetraheme cytochrome c subunit
MEPSNTSSGSSAEKPAPKRTGWVKFRFFLYSAMALLGAWISLMVIMTAAAAWYTSRPVFCSSCHNMVPYYESWQKSSHNQVACVKCHFPPGFGGEVRGKLMGLVQVIKYFTNSAGPKPTAEIPDESCLRSGCHETRLLSGQVDFHGTDSHGRPWHIPFDHTPHLQEGRRGKTLRCTSCHSQIVQGSHMTVTVSTCFLCHFKDEPFNAGLSACTHCHEVPKGELNLGGGVTFTHDMVLKQGVSCATCHRDVIRGKGEVGVERCRDCHNREGDFKQINDHVRLHQIHVTDHKVDCVRCHTPIEHNLQPGKIEIAATECQSCHGDPHQRQVDMLRGVGAKTLGEQPNMMLALRAECRTCHSVREVMPGGDIIFRGTLQSCAACHEHATVEKFETYHVALRSALPVLIKSAGEVEAAAKKGGVPADKAEKIAAEAANLRHDLELIGRGNDVHNMHFAANLVRQALDRLTALCRELKLEPPKVELPPVDTNPKR